MATLEETAQAQPPVAAEEKQQEVMRAAGHGQGAEVEEELPAGDFVFCLIALIVALYTTGAPFSHSTDLGGWGLVVTTNAAGILFWVVHKR